MFHSFINYLFYSNPCTTNRYSTDDVTIKLRQDCGKIKQANFFLDDT